MIATGNQTKFLRRHSQKIKYRKEKLAGRLHYALMLRLGKFNRSILRDWDKKFKAEKAAVPLLIRAWGYFIHRILRIPVRARRRINDVKDFMLDEAAREAVEKGQISIIKADILKHAKQADAFMGGGSVSLLAKAADTNNQNVE